LLKAILIIVVVIAIVLGGLLALRRSSGAGMPSEEVLHRATKRAREQEASEEKED
jgi:FtsZ-interacting cell division protein ZipA